MQLFMARVLVDVLFYLQDYLYTQALWSCFLFK